MIGARSKLGGRRMGKMGPYQVHTMHGHERPGAHEPAAAADAGG